MCAGLEGLTILCVMCALGRTYYPMCHVCIQQDLLSYVSCGHPEGLTVPCVMFAPRTIDFAYVS